MSLQEAEALLEKLENHFADYSAGKNARPQKKGFLQLLSHWVAYDVHYVEAEHEDFLRGTTELVRELATQLQGLTEEEQINGRKLAVQAVNLLLQPKVKQPRNDRERYLAVAEYSCIPLLPWLSGEELENYRTRLLAHTPRRMMYPNQLKLLIAMEDLLGISESR